jgi:hypothetical protein
VVVFLIKFLVNGKVKMTNFYKLPYKEKFRRCCYASPLGLFCVLLLFFLFKVPLWAVIVFIVIGIIQLIYYFLKSR